MDWMIKSENYTGIIKLSFVKRMCYGTFFLTLSDHQIPDNKKSGTGWDTDNKFFTVFVTEVRTGICFCEADARPGK